MAPPTCKTGDVTVFFLGGNMPFVIRPVGGQNAYRLVGPAYLHGYMDGEVVEELERGIHASSTLSLI